MEAIRQLFELGGGAAQTPSLRTYETPYPDPITGALLWPQPTESDKDELNAGAQLLLDSRERLTEKFGLSPWSIYEQLWKNSCERHVSFLALTRRLVASLRA